MRKIVITILVFCLLLASCVQKPEFAGFDINRMEYKDITELLVGFGIEVVNPNDFDLNVEFITYELFYNNTYIGKGRAEDSTVLLKNDTTLVNGGASISIKTILDNLPEDFNSDSISFEVLAQAKLERFKHVFSHKYPVTLNADAIMFKAFSPDLLGSCVKIKSIIPHSSDAKTTNLFVEVEFTNDFDLKLRIDSVGLDILTHKDSDAVLGHWNLRDTLHILPKTPSLILVRIGIDNKQAIQSIFNRVITNDLNQYVRGAAKINVNNKDYVIPVETSFGPGGLR